MDAISSTDFRKSYARLQRPTTVTVNGRAIGTWVPATIEVHTITQYDRAIVEQGDPGRFNSRPFTPVPKK